MPLRLDIVTVERLVYSGEVDMVIAPGIEGELGILPHHAPLLTALKYGELRVRRGDEEDSYAIGGGFMEVLPLQVTVMADTAQRAEEIDLERSTANILQLGRPVLPMKVEGAAHGDVEPGASAIARSGELEGYDLHNSHLLGQEGKLQAVFHAKIAAAPHRCGIFSVG